MACLPGGTDDGAGPIWISDVAGVSDKTRRHRVSDRFLSLDPDRQSFGRKAELDKEAGNRLVNPLLFFAPVSPLSNADPERDRALGDHQEVRDLVGIFCP